MPAVPETVALYLVSLDGTHRPATITRRLTPIAKAHAQLTTPTPLSPHIVVAETLQDKSLTLGTAQPGKTPLLTADLIKVVAHTPDSLSGTRDRALLMVGYTGSLRRSELAALAFEDLAWMSDATKH